MGGTNIFVGAGGGGYDVDDHEEDDDDVSEANIVVSEASKLSAGARIQKGSQGPEILVIDNTEEYIPLQNKLITLKQAGENENEAVKKEQKSKK